MNRSKRDARRYQQNRKSWAWRELNRKRAKAWRDQQKLEDPNWSVKEAARVKASKIKNRPAFYGFRGG